MFWNLYFFIFFCVFFCLPNSRGENPLFLFIFLYYKPFFMSALICVCDQYKLCEKVQSSQPLCDFFTLKSCHALVNTLCLYINKTAYNKGYKQLPISVCWLIEQYLLGNCSQPRPLSVINLIDTLCKFFICSQMAQVIVPYMYERFFDCYLWCVHFFCVFFFIASQFEGGKSLFNGFQGGKHPL